MFTHIFNYASKLIPDLVPSFPPSLLPSFPSLRHVFYINFKIQDGHKKIYIYIYIKVVGGDGGRGGIGGAPYKKMGVKNKKILNARGRGGGGGGGGGYRGGLL